MQGPPDPSSGQLRWQYVILWRYGGLGLVVVGLAMMGVGASGLQGVSISLTLLALGFASFLAGVVLPRIEGKFSAGSSGVAAELLAVHKLDTLTFTASAPALAAIKIDHARYPSTANENGQPANPITLGDVWDALEQAGFQVTGAATGKCMLEGPNGRSIVLHQRALLGWRIASGDLLAQVASWGIQPVASGKYRAESGVDPSMLTEPYSGVPLSPRS